MTELLPCPFCQSAACEIIGSEDKHPVERMAGCMGCGASAPLTLWNASATVFSKDDVEKAARAMCTHDGLEPNMMMPDEVPRWDYYVPGVRAALSAIGKVEVDSPQVDNVNDVGQ